MADEYLTQEEGDLSFRENWQPERHTYPRAIFMAVFVVVGFLSTITTGNVMFVIFAVILAACYIGISYEENHDDAEYSFLLLKEDNRENRRRDLKNTLIEAFIENGIIDKHTKQEQVEVWVIKLDPICFQCRLTQQGRRLEDIKERLERLCPIFDADHCYQTKLDNTAFLLDYIPYGLFENANEQLEWSRGAADLNDIPIGINAENPNETITVSVVGTNLICGGSTRSGKSVFLTCLAASLCSFENVALIMIDPKRTEFSKFRSRSSCYVRTQEEADAVLKAVVQEMERRYCWLENTPDYRTKITEYSKFPLLVLFIDELSYLLTGSNQTAGKSILNSITTLQQVGVACGITIIGATQKPSAEALKSTTFRDNFLQRIAFRTTTKEQTETILGKGAADGYPAEQIPPNAKGYAYASTETSGGTKLMKGFYISNTEAVAVALENNNKKVMLPWLDKALGSGLEE